MAHETRGVVQGGPVGARAEEWREAEPAGEDQPDDSLVPEPGAGHRGGAPIGMTPDEREARSRLGRYLNRSAFPADRAALTAAARAAQAPDDVLGALARLAPDGRYQTVSEVWTALGGASERGARF
jgi:Protein of unknown function (DUF2795)